MTSPASPADVHVGDTIEWTRIYRGFVGGGERRRHTSTVQKVTAKTVVFEGGRRITTNGWYDADPRIIARATDATN